jgi:hypothetical protein
VGESSAIGLLTIELGCSLSLWERVRVRGIVFSSNATRFTGKEQGRGGLIVEFAQLMRVAIHKPPLH